jgi:anti-anti-sigma factor
MTQPIQMQEQESAVVKPAGDLVAASLGELREGMRRLISSGAREITLDFSDVQMLDSRGIGLLIAAHNSLRQNGGRLALIHASAEILELLRAMRIHQHFSISGN